VPTLSQSGIHTPENMPVLDYGDCPYCCPASGSLTPASATSHPSPVESEDSDDDEELEAATIEQRGLTRERKYQDTLAAVKDKMLVNMRPVPVRLDFEPDNH